MTVCLGDQALYFSLVKQAYNLQNSVGDIMQQSILGQILPEAMVCYLENYGPEKFAEIFLGEFDTPEVRQKSICFSS